MLARCRRVLDSHGMLRHNATVNVAGLPRDALQSHLVSLTGRGDCASVAQQLHRAVHDLRPAECAPLPATLQTWLHRTGVAASLDTQLPSVIERHASADGTLKLLLRVPSGARVETVFIPESSSHGGTRGVVCVSTQAGCSLACSFCRTGTQGMQRNLSSADIVGQVLLMQREVRRADDARQVTNVVFMGQGEALFNFKAVSAAVRVLTDHHGCALAPRRITISTAGVAPRIRDVATLMGVNLAVSLHAPTDALRSRVMNINRTYPLSTLMPACEDYCTAARRRIMFAYTLLRGVNDSDTCAQQLVELLRGWSGIRCSVNVIPFNAWPGAPYQPSTPERTAAFVHTLTRAGLLVTLRQPRGADVLAACGQLKSSVEAAA